MLRKRYRLGGTPCNFTPNPICAVVATPSVMYTEALRAYVVVTRLTSPPARLTKIPGRLFREKIWSQSMLTNDEHIVALIHSYE